MRVLAVDHRRHALGDLLVHDVPDLGDPGTRRVDRRHAHVVEVLHLRERCAERGEDDDAAGRDVVEALAAVRGLVDELDAGVREHVVHARVVQQLVR